MSALVCVGLHAMMALDAGAHHVTAVEQWLYLCLACKLKSQNISCLNKPLL